MLLLTGFLAKSVFLGQLPALPAAPPPLAPHNLPEHPCTLLAVRSLTSNFQHHPVLEGPLLNKQHTRAHLPGALAEVNTVTDTTEDLDIPLVNAIKWAFLTSVILELKTLADALKQADADKWVDTALAEINAHVQNGTWVLTQLPPGRQAISSCWVFKVKQLPDGSVDKYKGHIVAQGFLQVQGIHYNDVFAPTA